MIGQMKLSIKDELEILKSKLEEVQKDYEELNERIFKKDYSDHYELKLLRDEMKKDSAKCSQISNKIKLLELKKDI